MFYDDAKPLTGLKFNDNPGIINIQNVYDYWLSTPEQSADFLDCFSFKTPFELTWFQCKTYRGQHVGMLCRYIEKPEDNSEVDQILMSFFFGSDPITYSGDILIDIDPKTGKYIPIRREGEGKELQDVVRARWNEEDERVEQFQQMGLAPDLGMRITLIMALNFLHCRNVHLQDQPIMKKTIERRQKKRLPFIEQTHVIVIEPMKKVLDTEGDAQNEGLAKAFHICRGHFKSYEEGKGLFGKFHGTYFWGSHTRGNIDNGKVNAVYTIKT